MELTPGNCVKSPLGRKEEIHIKQRDDRQRHLITIEFEFLRSDGGLLILPFVIGMTNATSVFYFIANRSR